MRREWTKEEVEKFKEMYPNNSNKKLADIFDRSYNSITKKGHRLNLKKTKDHKSKIYSEANKGVNSGNFKGYRIVNSNGYVMLNKPNRDSSQSSGYILEHRYKMENKLGRILKDNEIVHHINGNKKDNRIENLELMTIKEHQLEHNLGAKRSKEAKKNMSKAQSKKYSNMSKEDHPHYKDFDINKLEKLRDDGKTLKKACDELNISVRTYYNRLKEKEMV